MSYLSPFSCGIYSRSKMCLRTPAEPHLPYLRCQVGMFRKPSVGHVIHMVCTEIAISETFYFVHRDFIAVPCPGTYRSISPMEGIARQLSHSARSKTGRVASLVTNGRNSRHWPAPIPELFSCVKRSQSILSVLWLSCLSEE